MPRGSNVRQWPSLTQRHSGMRSWGSYLHQLVYTDLPALFISRYILYIFLMFTLTSMEKRYRLGALAYLVPIITVLIIVCLVVYYTKKRGSTGQDADSRYRRLFSRRWLPSFMEHERASHKSQHTWNIERPHSELELCEVRETEKNIRSASGTRLLTDSQGNVYMSIPTQVQIVDSIDSSTQTEEYPQPGVTAQEEKIPAGAYRIADVADLEAVPFPHGGTTIVVQQPVVAQHPYHDLATISVPQPVRPVALVPKSNTRSSTALVHTHQHQPGQEPPPCPPKLRFSTPNSDNSIDPPEPDPVPVSPCSSRHSGQSYFSPPNTQPQQEDRASPPNTTAPSNPQTTTHRPHRRYRRQRQHRRQHQRYQCNRYQETYRSTSTAQNSTPVSVRVLSRNGEPRSLTHAYAPSSNNGNSNTGPSPVPQSPAPLPLDYITQRYHRGDWIDEYIPDNDEIVWSGSREWNVYTRVDPWIFQGEIDGELVGYRE
ncbi:hypothetical protein F5884DRAFT_460630 [Xylogone sp. PMI_703]|nr:hypothetical protein F5884DRAFT_460630 [Xylogone sp. PMI_703]